MDVTCPSCGAKYVFDSTLLSPRGTHVRCTQCHHAFTVYSRETAPASSTQEWEILCVNGAQLTISSFRELQRLIRRREVAPQDRLRRPGKPAKPLGEIAELEPFFAAARGTVSGEHAVPELTAPFDLSQMRPSRPALYVSDQDERPSFVIRRRSVPWKRMLFWLVMFAGTATLGYAAAVHDWLDKTQTWLLLQEKDEQLVARTRDAVDRAESPTLLTALADLAEHTEASTLDSLRIRVEGHAALAHLLSLGEHQKPEDEVSLHAQAALRLARKAQALEEANGGRAAATTRIAVAHALHLTGDNKQSLRILDETIPSHPDERGRWHFVRALASNVEDVQGARESFGTQLDEAVSLVPTWIPGRLVTAHVLCNEGNRFAADGHIDEVLKYVPGHPDAVNVRAHCTQQLERSKDIRKTDDTNELQQQHMDPQASSHADTVEERTRLEETTLEQEQRTEEKPEEITSPKVVRSYSQWVERGDEQLATGALSGAESSFERALSLNSRGGDALSGLGFVALERGALGNATSYFRKAAAEGNVTALIGLGQALRGLGKSEKAAAAYRRYLKSAPNGNYASVARAQLKALSYEEQDDNSKPSTPPTDTLELE